TCVFGGYYNLLAHYTWRTQWRQPLYINQEGELSRIVYRGIRQNNKPGPRDSETWTYSAHISTALATERLERLWRKKDGTQGRKNMIKYASSHIYQVDAEAPLVRVVCMDMKPIDVAREYRNPWLEEIAQAEA